MLRFATALLLHRCVACDFGYEHFGRRAWRVRVEITIVSHRVLAQAEKVQDSVPTGRIHRTSAAGYPAAVLLFFPAHPP